VVRNRSARDFASRSSESSARAHHPWGSRAVKEGADALLPDDDRCWKQIAGARGRIVA